MSALRCVIAVSAFAGCTPDEAALRDHVPEFFQIKALESTDYHVLNCYRATYLVAPPGDAAFSHQSSARDSQKEYKSWQRLEDLGSSSFLRCVDAKEQALWQPSIDAGQAIETGDANDRHLRIWYDPVGLRLLVLVYHN
jgi:hypothetical protein